MTVDLEPATVVGSIVFTDLVGFTEFNGAAGDAAAMALLDAQTQLVDEYSPPAPTPAWSKRSATG